MTCKKCNLIKIHLNEANHALDSIQYAYKKDKNLVQTSNRKAKIYRVALQNIINEAMKLDADITAIAHIANNGIKNGIKYESNENDTTTK